MRKAITNGDWETFKKLMPDDNFYDDVVQILNKQTNSQEVTSEGFFTETSQFSLGDRPILKEVFNLINEIEKEEYSYILSEQEEPMDSEKILKTKTAEMILNPSLVPSKNISPQDKQKMLDDVFKELQASLKSKIKRFSKDPEEIEKEMAMSEESSMAAGHVQVASGEQDHDSIIR
jgi:hypothetical protein